VRGLYVLSEPSEVSEPQASDPAENDTGFWPVSELSETGDEASR
jgi:hypothetical protein